jgi:acetolactate synthase I/II/III large subunit
VKASDFVAHYLKARGVTHVFELVGGMITHLLDSISAAHQVKIVSCHHEQAAGFAAEGYARTLGIPGVALATSGPGATNLLTAIGSCFFDSTATIFITGQVNTHELKRDRRIRQLGFQETDIVAMATPICKSAVQVHNVEELPLLLDTAFRIALEGRQGPCLVDIPMNVQSDEINDQLANLWLESAQHSSLPDPCDFVHLSDNKHQKRWFEKLLKAISNSQRPLLLMGGGCAASFNRQAALQIADHLQLPVVLSLMAVDLLPELHPYRVGFIGSYGNRWANKALGSADLLVVLGSRLDIRQTGSDIESFSEGKQIWQIDIDSAEIGVRINPQYSLICTIQNAAICLEQLDRRPNTKHRAWIEWINVLRFQFPPFLEYSTNGSEINPILLLQRISSCAKVICNYVTDVGQHQMWAAQCLNFKQSDRFLTSGGMGAMGFGLPAAIGSAISSPESMTILISGDGSFQVNIQELETVRRNQLNLKIIIFNNNCHGMVRQFQESYFNGNLQSTVKGYSAPDFVAVSQAYGIPSRRISSVDEVDAIVHWLFDSNGPVLLDVSLSVYSKVYPKLAFGRRFGEMEPEASPIAMEST